MIQTVKELVQALGGNQVVGDALTLGKSSISNWIAADSIPFDRRPVFADSRSRLGWWKSPRWTSTVCSSSLTIS